MPFKVVPPLWHVWWSMRQRCENPRIKQFADYGGRGISVCERWKDYKAFAEDMPPRPSRFHSLDRIDNDGPYSPENCRWATRKEQQRNQRRAVYVVIEGQKYRAIELSDQTGLKVDTIVARAALGLSYAEVVSPKRRPVQDNFSAIGVAAKKAKAAAKTHCSKGHALTSENTYVSKEGRRFCRQCHAAKMRRLSRKKATALQEADG